jgi:hypothetical protein
VATSVEIFHEKLPRSAIRCLQGEKFDVERVEETLAKVFNDALFGRKSALWLGPALCKQLLERQRDHVQNIQAFVSALKVSTPMIVTLPMLSLVSMRICLTSTQTRLAFYSLAIRPVCSYKASTWKQLEISHRFEG